MNKLVSIIVPIYNTEKYLERCIDSLINQTYKNIEIILINDGSTDNSINILKKYKKIDTRIKIIDKKNEGPNIARKTGLENADGNYIMFVDSDDYIHPNTVEILVSKINEYQVVYFDMTCNSFEITNVEHILKQDDIRNILLTSKKFNPLCTGIYKRSLFKNIKAFKLAKTQYNLFNSSLIISP